MPGKLCFSPKAIRNVMSLALAPPSKTGTFGYTNSVGHGRAEMLCVAADSARALLTLTKRPCDDCPPTEGGAGFILGGSSAPVVLLAPALTLAEFDKSPPAAAGTERKSKLEVPLDDTLLVRDGVADTLAFAVSPGASGRDGAAAGGAE